MRFRFVGDRMFTIDARAKPFRHSDLSPREELSEARQELAQLEEWRIANTKWKTWPATDRPNMRRIEELKKKVYALDYWINDSASKATGVQSTADLNRRHANFTGARNERTLMNAAEELQHASSTSSALEPQWPRSNAKGT